MSPPAAPPSVRSGCSQSHGASATAARSTAQAAAPVLAEETAEEKFELKIELPDGEEMVCKRGGLALQTAVSSGDESDGAFSIGAKSRMSKRSGTLAGGSQKGAAGGEAPRSGGRGRKRAKPPSYWIEKLSIQRAMTASFDGRDQHQASLAAAREQGSELAEEGSRLRRHLKANQWNNRT